MALKTEVVRHNMSKKAMNNEGKRFNLLLDKKDAEIQ